MHPEGLGLEQHVVEGGLGLEGLEPAEEVIGSRFFAVGRVYEGLCFRPDVGFPGAGTSQHVVALPLQRRGVGQQDRHGGQEHRCHLAAPPRTHEPAHRLGEEQRSRGGRRIDPDRQPRHVHPLRDHPDRHHPAILSRGELLDPPAGPGIVGEDHGGAFPRDPGQDLRVGARHGLIGGYHQAACIGDGATHLRQALVSGPQHGGDPLARRRQGGAPGVGGQVLGEHRSQVGVEHLPGAHPPTHLSAVVHEDHGPHHVVRQSLPVAVGVVGPRDPDPRLGFLIGHERDRAVIGAERGAG